jgi:ribosomal protein L11 methyltransferase
VPLFLDALEPEGVSVAAIEEPAGGGADAEAWRIEILHDEQPDGTRLAARLAAIAERAGLPQVDLTQTVLPGEDWLARTAEQFPPQHIGRFWIHGSHLRESAPAGSVPILIDAGRAFGSGEHATTRGCLLVLDRLRGGRRLRRVLDLGCGSAILGIAAAKRGAARVIAADNDPTAVATASENAALNGVERRVTCTLSEGFASPAVRRGAPYDLILANILADPLARMARTVARHLAPHGLVVLSGLLEQQAGAVLAAYRAQHLRAVAHIDEAPWSTLVLARVADRRGRLRMWPSVQDHHPLRPVTLRCSARQILLAQGDR